MKQLTKRIFLLFLSLILMLSAGVTALASGEGNGSCTCNKEDSKECPAAKYLTGTWDISEFFHSEDRKEAAA